MIHDSRLGLIGYSRAIRLFPSRDLSPRVNLAKTSYKTCALDAWRTAWRRAPVLRKMKRLGNRKTKPAWQTRGPKTKINRFELKKRMISSQPSQWYDISLKGGLSSLAKPAPPFVIPCNATPSQCLPAKGSTAGVERKSKETEQRTPKTLDTLFQ